MSAARISLWSRARSHAQTVSSALPFKRARPRGLAHHPVELPIPEGGVIVALCDWQPKPAPAVIVLHGVAGSSDDAYVVRTAHELLRAGFHVLRLNGRGSGRGRGRAQRLYHAGMAEDVDIAARYLAARVDVTAVGALGFSLGGHIALVHAADTSAHAATGVPAWRATVGTSTEHGPTPLKAVATISAPVDLGDTMRAFDRGARGLTGVYERLMVRSLVDKARALKERRGDEVPYTLAEIARITRMRGFDDVVTVRCNGFRDAADYHDSMSVGPRLADIRIPTLMLHAADDPVVPAAALSRVARSEHVDVVVTPSGGHVGFVEEVSHLWGGTSAVLRATAHLARHLKES